MGSTAVATAEPRERGILFTGANVLKILAGTKTQTRRIVKPHHGGKLEGPSELPSVAVERYGKDGLAADYVRCPYGAPGERLWVREAWRVRSTREGTHSVAYRADCLPHEDERWRWKPSIHMPRWASRMTLEITDVRVERLQDITESVATAEGVTLGMRWADSTYPPRSAEYRYKVQETPREAFARSWNDLHGAGAWEANLWVWAITFARLP